mgnify:CR=1 FL=1
MTRDEALAQYRAMLLIRRFEERCAQVYVEGKIGGFLHLYIGQEAVAVGAMSLLRPDDYFITSYRDHGYALARGTDPRPLMAELYGKIGGISRGKGGSMHFYDVPTGNFGGDGIVEMAAYRPFGGPLDWPTWWKSKMWVDATRHEIRYQHIGGITTGTPASAGNFAPRSSKRVHAATSAVATIASTIARIRCLSPGSATSSDRFPCRGRMLMNAVNSSLASLSLPMCRLKPQRSSCAEPPASSSASPSA